MNKINSIVWGLLLFVFLGAKNTNIDVDKESVKDVVIALDSEPKTLDPRLATDANGMRIVNLIFQSLVQWGPHNELIPAAAEKWNCSDKMCVFYVKKDIYFSNGRQIKAEDILFSFHEYQSEKYPFFSAFKEIHSVEITETKNHFLLTLNLKRPSAKFLKADLPVLKILPRKETLSAGEMFYKNPIGSGAFELQEKNSNRIRLKSRKATHSAPYIDRVTFKIIRDDFTRFQKTLNGEIDIAQSVISLNKIKRFMKKSKQFQVVRSLGTSVTYLLINLKDPCLSQKTVRQALSLSIDVPQMINYKLKGFASSASSLISKNNFFFNAPTKPILYEPHKARQLMDKNLCQNKVLSLKSSSSQEAVSHARVLSRQIQKGTGISIRQESFEWGTFYGDINNGRFQLALLKWVGVVDPDIYRLAFHSAEWAPKGRNRGFYKNKVLDDLLIQGQFTMDRRKRKDIYNKIQMIIMRDMPIIPLWHQDQVSIVKKTIRGYHLNSQGDFGYLTKIQILE